MIYVKIEETNLYPTNKQAQACLRVCQMLSSYYRDIENIRFAEETLRQKIEEDDRKKQSPPNISEQ